MVSVSVRVKRNVGCLEKKQGGVLSDEVGEVHPVGSSGGPRPLLSP